jgi:transcriptional regulator with XRE-family HTH domain
MDGVQIRELRREVGLTQQEIAWALGVSKRTVIRWERGHCPMRAKFVGAFTHLLFDGEMTAHIKATRPPDRRRARLFKKNMLTQN